MKVAGIVHCILGLNCIMVCAFIIAKIKIETKKCSKRTETGQLNLFINYLHWKII